MGGACRDLCVLIAVVSCIDNASATMLEDDSSSAFSRHLELGLILLCSVCPMSLNYWFHLVQSMTCRCASLNVYGFYLAWPLTRCVCEGAFAPPLVGDSFFLFLFLLSSFPSSFLFLYLDSFPPSFQSDQRHSQVHGVFDLDVSENHVGSDTPQSRAVSRGLKRPQSGPKTVPSGILEPESRVPQAGGDCVGLSWGGKTTSSP
ncbi:hypothetical protein J3E69DRAFT_179020 [Trichoderma sp. SZMC 28015]